MPLGFDERRLGQMMCDATPRLVRAQCRQARGSRGEHRSCEQRGWIEIAAVPDLSGIREFASVRVRRPPP
jgi:hypothetical protein